MPPRSTKAESTSVARDVFLYVLMMFVLGASATALGTILFQLINIYLPASGVGYYVADARSVIQFPLASLVVMFPVLAWVIRFLNRDMTANPAKRDMKIRKWLLYLALFIAGVTMLGDLVTLIYNFLQGDLTLRFILKVGVVLWLAGSIFIYFLKDLHDQAPGVRRVIRWITAIIVVAALGVGFWVAGSPAAHRAANNDAQRVNNLQMIESQIISYWQTKGTLPPDLDALADGTISGSAPMPTDPMTNEPYQYVILGERSYQLCATFQSDTNSSASDRLVPPVPYYYGVTTWTHGVGYTCFSGTIDPDRYPPVKK